MGRVTDKLVPDEYVKLERVSAASRVMDAWAGRETGECSLRHIGGDRDDGLAEYFRELRPSLCKAQELCQRFLRMRERRPKTLGVRFVKSEMALTHAIGYAVSVTALSGASGVGRAEGELGRQRTGRGQDRAV